MAQKAIATIQKAWPTSPVHVAPPPPTVPPIITPVGRGRPKKVASVNTHPHTPQDVATLFSTVKGHTVREVVREEVEMTDVGERGRVEIMGIEGSEGEE